MSGHNGGDQGRRPASPQGEKYDLELLMTIVEEERAFDESVKVRVTQEEIQKLIEKKRRKRR